MSDDVTYINGGMRIPSINERVEMAGYIGAEMLIRRLGEQVLNERVAHIEAMLRVYMEQTGLPADRAVRALVECFELVEQRDGNQITWFFRKRDEQ